MIQTKEDQRQYLEQDRVALWQTSKKPRFMWNGTGSQLIWKYERKLRNYEYYLNNSNIIRALLYKYAHTMLGIKSGIDVPPNSFGQGLGIVHLGYVVMSPKSKSEK